MSDRQKLLVVITRGLDDERASVAWIMASTGVASEFEVTVFLASSGVDWVRRGAADVARLNPLDPPIGELIANVIDNGGTIMACPPCAKVRGYEDTDLIDGVTVAGAAAMLEIVKQGAKTLTF